MAIATALFLSGCSAEQQPTPQVATVTPTIATEHLDNNTLVLLEELRPVLHLPTSTPTMAPTPTPEPPKLAPLPVESSRVSAAGWATIPEWCWDSPERFNWKYWAAQVGFPQHVIDGELEHIISKESGGDLCAQNTGSKASCWIQQYPWYDGIFDPYTCMMQGFTKYQDGVRRMPDNPFWPHWYQWWN